MRSAHWRCCGSSGNTHCWKRIIAPPAASHHFFPSLIITQESKKKCFPPYWQIVYGEPTSQVELSYASKIVHRNTDVKGTRLSFAKCCVLTRFLGGWGPPNQPSEESVSSPGLWGLGLQQRVGVLLCLEVCIFIDCSPTVIKETGERGRGSSGTE